MRDYKSFVGVYAYNLFYFTLGIRLNLLQTIHFYPSYSKATKKIFNLVKFCFPFPLGLIPYNRELKHTSNHDSDGSENVT